MTTPSPIVTYIQDRDNWKMIAMVIMFVIILLLSTCLGKTKEQLHKCLDDCGQKKIELTPPDKEPINTVSDIPEPEIQYRDTGSIQYVDRWHTLYQDTGRIDTVFIIRDWFAFRMYADTLRNDSSAFIAVYDTLTQNKLVGRSYAFQNRRGDNVVEVEKDLRFRVFAGGFLGYKQDYFGAGLGVSFIPKNDLYMAGYEYDLLNNVHSARLQWKLSFRR